MDNCYCPNTAAYGNPFVNGLVASKLASTHGFGGAQTAAAPAAPAAPAPLIVAQPTAVVQQARPNVEILAACQTKNIIIDRDTKLNVTELSTKKTSTSHSVGPRYPRFPSAPQGAPDVKVHVDVAPNVVVEEPAPVCMAPEVPKEMYVNVDVPVNFERTITKAVAPAMPTYTTVVTEPPLATTPCTQAPMGTLGTVVSPQSTVVYRGANQCTSCN